MKGAHDFEAVEWWTPEQQARQLASYIRDASAIRAHCFNHFGRAPSYAYIEGLLKDEQRSRDRHKRLAGEPVERLSVPLRYDPPREVFTLSDLVSKVCAFFDVRPTRVLGEGRTRSLVYARAVTAWVLRERGWSYPRIGMALKRDHSTIIHAVRSLPIYIKIDPKVGDALIEFAPVSKERADG